MNKDIFEMSAERNEAEPGWRLVTDISKTTDHIRQIAVSESQSGAANKVLMSCGYINRRPNENPEQFHARLRLTYLPAGYSETVGDATAKITRRDKWFELSEKIHPDILPLLQDMDMNGNSIEVVSVNLAYEMINLGVTGGYIEHGDSKTYGDEFEIEHGRRPSAKEIPENLTRPYFVHIAPQSVVNAEVRNISGIENPSLVVTKEESRNDDDDKYKVFNLKEEGYTIDSVQVIEGAHVSIAAVTPKINGEALHDMPFVVGYASKQVQTGYYTATPPLYRLAENTVELMNAKSELDYLISIIQIPILYLSTRDTKQDIPIGAAIAIKISIGDTIGYVVPPAGASVEAGERRVERIKDDRAHMGMASMLSSSPGNVAATTKALDTVQADSKLHSVALSLEDLLSNIVGWFHTWKGLPVPDGKLITISMDFGLPEKPNMDEAKQLTVDWMAGMISDRTALGAKKAIMPSLSEMDIENELELIGSRGE